MAHTLRILIPLVFLIIVLLPLLLILGGIQSKPLVVTGHTLAYDDVARIKQLVKQNDPRKLKPGQINTALFTERDVNLFLHYALSQSHETQRIMASMDFKPKTALLKMTITLPANPVGRYVNIIIAFEERPPLLTIHTFRIGSLHVPRILLKFIFRYGHRFFSRFDDYREIVNGIRSIEHIQLEQDQLSITYQWDPQIMNTIRDQGRNLLLPTEEQQRLLVYQQQIAQISNHISVSRTSITTFLIPLFQLAQDRSLKQHNPVAENRAILITLTTYATGRKLDRLISRELRQTLHRPRPVDLTLLGRHDLALHFLVSAAITGSSGSRLANLAGVFKEVDDSRGGSGFSFADLAADRAGVRFAEIAVQTRRSATWLQGKVSAAIDESDIMPSIKNLPEGIMELQFKKKFNDLDSDQFQQVNNEIERRINECRLYRSFP